MASSSSSTPPQLEANETRNWVELPRDVMAMILHKLGAIHILESAQKVCMTWRNICKDPAMWRSIDMRNPGDLWSMPYNLEKMARHAIDRSCGELVDINLEYFVTDELLQYLADRASQLRRLRLACCSEISDEGLSEAAKKLPLLEELHIYLSPLSKVSLETVGRCCPRLKSLKFNDRRTRSPYRSSYLGCDDEVAIVIGETMPGLHDLQLFGNKMTNDGLQAILDGCPHLESLDLRQCFNVHLVGPFGKRCSERVKVLQHPYDPTDDYEFDTTIYDDDEDSFDDEYPSGFSEIDFLSDVDNDYEFSGGGSDYSDYGELFFDDY